MTGFEQLLQDHNIPKPPFPRHPLRTRLVWYDQDLWAQDPDTLSWYHCGLERTTKTWSLSTYGPQA